MTTEPQPTIRTTGDVCPQPHLLIAGTGRAGTSFLVRYLSELGLDTHLRRHGPDARIDEAANAGLEDIPLSSVSEDLPYVVKTPWAFEFIDEMLSDPHIHIDGVIIPVRDLGEAASSRTILEQRALIENVPWWLRLRRTWNHIGITPGGILASLEPLDQMRILASGFHHLVQRLVVAEVPFRLVAFPRLATDANYLFDHIHDLLPHGLERAGAAEAHRRVADPHKIRVGSELEGLSHRSSQPTVAELERAALSREFERLRARVEAADQIRDSATQEVERLSARCADLETESQVRHNQAVESLAQAKREIERLGTERNVQQERIDQLHADCSKQIDLIHRLSCISHEQQNEISALRLQITAAQKSIELIRKSFSWRLTSPIRRFGYLMWRAR